MKRIFEQVVSCDDQQVKNNVIRILADSCEIGMNGEAFLETLREVKSELGECSYDEDMAMLHLCLIKNVHCKEAAISNYSSIKDTNISCWDFVVLWGEMVKRHGEKIRRWFPHIKELDFEQKTLDECKNYLSSGKKPFYDLNL